jgi:hypothetical protein
MERSQERKGFKVMSMMRRSLSIVLILFMITVSTVSVYADTYIPHLEVSAENIYFAAGRQGEVTIKVNNSGGYDVFEVENILTAATPGITILSNAHKVINKIKYQENVSYQVALDIDQNVPVGAYTLQLQLKYLRLDTQISLTIPVSIVVNQVFVPSIKIIASSESAKLNANYDGEFSYTIENIGESDVHNLNIAFSSSSPFIAVTEGQKKTVSELKIGGKMELKMGMRILESATLGPYSISASLNFDSEGRSLRQNSALTFEVTSSKNPILVVKNSSPGLSVLPGVDFKVNLNIRCSDAVAYNVKAQLSLDQKGLLAPLSSTTIPLGDLKPNTSIDVAYDLQIDGNSVPGQLPIILTLSYLNSKGITLTTNEVITINVDGFVSFRLLKDQVFTLEQGKTGKIDTDLLLIGLTRVEFTSISIVEGGSFVTTVGSSEYMGAIDPDSPVPFTLQVKVVQNATIGDDVIHARVSYLDQRNVFREKILDLPVTIVKPSVLNVAANDGGFWGWLRSLLGLKP